MRCLVVEDDFTSRRLLQRLLLPFGDCDAAVDGDEALAAFDDAHAQGEPYELILLDIMMPTVTGFEVLSAIRHRERDSSKTYAINAKIIMTSALESNDHVIDSFAQGCEAYLIKPIERAKLMLAIQACGLTEK